MAESSDDQPQSDDEKQKQLKDRLEIGIATLLGIAAVFIAVVGYQATLRDGDSIKSFNEGIRTANDSNGFYNDALSVQNRDQQLFVEFAKAAQEDKTDLAAYLQTTIMDDNLRGALDEWQKDKTDKIATPLDAASYEQPDLEEGDRLAKVTDVKFNQARTLDNQGDKFSLIGVIVASSLFFLGIAGVMTNIRTKIVGTAAGAISLTLALGIWLTML